MEYWECRQQLADRCMRVREPYVPQGAHQRFLIDARLFLGKNFPSPPLNWTLPATPTKNAASMTTSTKVRTVQAPRLKAAPRANEVG